MLFVLHNFFFTKQGSKEVPSSQQTKSDILLWNYHLVTVRRITAANQLMVCEHLPMCRPFCPVFAQRPTYNWTYPNLSFLLTTGAVITAKKMHKKIIREKTQFLTLMLLFWNKKKNRRKDTRFKGNPKAFPAFCYFLDSIEPTYPVALVGLLRSTFALKMKKNRLILTVSPVADSASTFPSTLSVFYSFLTRCMCVPSVYFRFLYFQNRKKVGGGCVVVVERPSNHM